MKKFEIVRVCENENSTFGVLVYEFRPIAVTLEDAWRDNEKNISCIPPGIYRCERYPSKKFGMTFLVMNVPGRSGILFHKGNTHEDTRGCILLGAKFGVINQLNGIEYSGAAFGRFMHRLRDDDSFVLEIRDATV